MVHVWKALSRFSTERFSVRLGAARGKRISYSQLGEDVWVMRNWLNVRRNDIIAIEVGAYDPFRYSNTFGLERYLASSSILVEPSLRGATKIQKERPKASLYCALAWENCGLQRFLGDSAVAGIEATLTDGYISQWDLSVEPRRWVPAIPLGAIQAVENLEYVDALFVDVQGAEFEVLNGIDWGRPIGCICIELEGVDVQKDEACRSLLNHRGYVFRSRLEINEFWTLRNYARRHQIWSQDEVPPVDSFVYPYLEPHASARVLRELRLPPIPIQTE